MGIANIVSCPWSESPEEYGEYRDYYVAIYPSLKLSISISFSYSSFFYLFFSFSFSFASYYFSFNIPILVPNFFIAFLDFDKFLSGESNILVYFR